MSHMGRERYNIEDGFRSITKWSGYINDSNRIPEFIRRAYTMLRTGHPSPVLLQLPSGLDDFDPDNSPYIPVKGWRSAGDPADVEKVVTALHNSKNHDICRTGCVFGDACGELRRFVELTKVPVLTTLMGKSCFPENHPLSLG